MQRCSDKKTNYKSIKWYMQRLIGGQSCVVVLQHYSCYYPLMAGPEFAKAWIFIIPSPRDDWHTSSWLLSTIKSKFPHDQHLNSWQSILEITDQVAIKFVVDIHVPQRIDRKVFDDPLTFPLLSSSGQNFQLCTKSAGKAQKCVSVYCHTLEYNELCRLEGPQMELWS